MKQITIEVPDDFEMQELLIYNEDGKYPRYVKAHVCETAIQALEREPKTGHWIDHQVDRWIYAQCSECGEVHDSQSDYCPSCGTKMDIDKYKAESEEQT